MNHWEFFHFRIRHSKSENLFIYCLQNEFYQVFVRSLFKKLFFLGLLSNYPCFLSSFRSFFDMNKPCWPKIQCSCSQRRSEISEYFHNLSILTLKSVLLYCYRLGQIARLINISASNDRDMIGKQLERHYVYHRRQNGWDLR